MPHGTIEIEGRRYECIFSISKAERAPRENGQALWPDEPEYINDVEAVAYTPKGTVRVTSERIMNRIHKKLTEDL